jgi:hypothetical protein
MEDVMSEGKSGGIRIPNTVLVVAAVGFMAFGVMALQAGDRSLAISTFAGAGISLSLLDFSFPSLSLPLKLLLTPILLLPFASMGAVALGLV